jgi:hypothetical protein
MNVQHGLWHAAVASLWCGVALAQSQAPVECATSPAQLRAVDLTELFLRHKGELDVRSRAGCLRLATGSELPTVLLVLPPFSAPYAVRFEAPTDNGGYLQPRVDLLDAQYQTLRSFGAERVRRRGTRLSMEVFINEANAAERFVMLHADPEHLGEQDHRTTSQSQMLFVGTGYVVLGADRTAALHSSTEGHLTVLLVGEAWDKAQRAQKAPPR